MKQAQIKKVVVGPVMTNCYVCKNTADGRAVIIDPGDEPERISALVQALEASVDAILLTHGHFDHILAADALRKRFDAKIYALKEEEELLLDPELNLSFYHGCTTVLRADRLVNDGDTVNEAGFSFRVIHTPGHTGGSCCYYIPGENVLFSGDTLFCHSHGRTDFATGSARAIIKSIRERLLTLDPQTDVFPGHDRPTTISAERCLYL